MLFKKERKEEHEDLYVNHTKTTPYCGKKFYSLYKNGWIEGDIEDYNENICKYNVSFNDGSEDYIGEDNIGMIQVIVF